MSAAHALLLEARVLTRDGVVPAELADRLQGRLERVEGPLDGAMVATLALISAARGDRSDAARLLESLAWLPPAAVGEELTAWAQGWLLTDAAAAGDWARVTALASPATLEGRFFSALAGRLQGGEARVEADDLLRLPTEARAFFELGGAPAPCRRNAGSVVVALGPGPEEVRAALAALLSLRPATLELTAQAVATLLSARALREHLFERATLLGGGSPDEALDELRSLMRARLGSALDDGVPVSAPLLLEAARTRREALLASLEVRLDTLTRQCDQAPALPLVWRDFVGVVHDTRLATRLSDPDARTVPHQVVVRRLRYLGAWLRVTKDQQAFAKAVFGQLEALAREAGDEVAAGLAAIAATWCRA